MEERYIKPFARNNQNRQITAENTIALVCHPRGGSSWFGEILLNIQGSLLISEPLWRGFYRSVGYKPTIAEGKLKQFSKLGFYFDQPIPFDAKWQEAKIEMEYVLKGHVWNYGLYDRDKLKKLKNKEIFIIKYCYGHLLLPWLQNNFDIKSIVLHRHPCAVVASQLSHLLSHKIDINSSGIIQDFRYNDIFKRYNHIWKTISSKEEYLSALWSIKTKYIMDAPLEQSNWLTIYYEKLLTDFKVQMGLIQKYLDVLIKESSYQNKDKPSESSVRKGQLIHTASQIGKWKSILSRNQIERILNIVNKFGIELYDDELMPHL